MECQNEVISGFLEGLVKIEVLSPINDLPNRMIHTLISDIERSNYLLGTIHALIYVAHSKILTINNLYEKCQGLNELKIL